MSFPVSSRVGPTKQSSQLFSSVHIKTALKGEHYERKKNRKRNLGHIKQQVWLKVTVWVRTCTGQE